MPQRIDLFDAAKRNAVAIEDEYTRESSKKPKMMRDVKSILDKSRVSTNKKCDGLIGFLEQNHLPSGYRYAQEVAWKYEMSVTTPDEFAVLLIKEWGKDTPSFYVHRRVEFLKSFDKGEDHLFGALYMEEGPPGAAAKNGAYGEYCIVFKKELFERLSDVAYCKYDTLAHDEYWHCDHGSGECLGSKENNACPARKKRPNTFQDFKCRIDFDKLFADYAPHSHRAFLAAIKHKDNPEWDPLNSIEQKSDGSTEDYIEVCFVLHATRDDIEKVICHPQLIHSVLEEICIPNEELNSKASILAIHERAWRLLKKYGIDLNPPFIAGYENA